LGEKDVGKFGSEKAGEAVFEDEVDIEIISQKSNDLGRWPILALIP
jgi:hypothetical protein